MFENFGPLSSKKLNTIRGKTLMTNPSPKDDVWKVFGYIDWLEDKLAEFSEDDRFGTEGWRHLFGHPDED